MRKLAVPYVTLACLLLLAVACGGGGQPNATQPPAAPSSTPVAATPVAAAATATPTPEPTAVEPTAHSDAESSATPLPASPTPTAPDTATPAPACTVLSQGLNLRPGPGTAYDPPLAQLPQDTLLLPMAFSPFGFPQGSWLQVQVPSAGQSGWVSASSEFVTCNVPVTELPPPADIPPTPTPPPPTLTPTPASIIAQLPNLSDDLGICDPPLRCELIPLPDGFLRVRVYDEDEGTQDGAGISHVYFEVRDSQGRLVHERTERQAGYCIFGGGEPDCNPWTVEGGVYKWQSSGDAVVDGEEYAINIHVYRAGQDFFEANWFFSFTLDLP